MPFHCELCPGTKGRDPTHPHQRHREAPLQEARQAAPSGACLEWPCNENSRFSDEPVAKLRKLFCCLSFTSVLTNARFYALLRTFPSSIFSFRQKKQNGIGQEIQIFS